MKRSFIIMAAFAVSMVAMASSCVTVYKDGEQTSVSIFGIKISNDSVKLSRNCSVNTLSVAPYTGIDVDLPCSIEYHLTGEKGKIEVKAPDNIHDRIVFSVIDSILYISLKDGLKLKSSNIELDLYNDVLSSIDCSSSVALEVENPIVTDSLSVRLEGAVALELDGVRADSIDIRCEGTVAVQADDIDCRFIRVRLDGVGSAELKGRADKGDFTVGGVGSIDIGRMEIGEVSKSVYGVGKIK